MSNRKRLISNFLSLSSVQVANYVFPLITVPYLVRVLGPEKFGLLAFAQAFIGYFGLVTDYGFGLSATRSVSIHRDNKERVDEIFSSVVLIKAALMILSFLVMCIVVFSIPRFRAEWLVYIFTFGVVLGGVLFPSWLFQGLEKMKQIAIFNMFSRAFFTICIFIFIRSQNDYPYVPLITAIGSLFVGIIALLIVLFKLEVKFRWPESSEIKYQLREGWHIFISTIAISLYTISNTFILGIFAGTTVVGYFSAGEKIVKAVQGLMGPLSQTVYPHISKLANESRDVAMAFMKRLVRIIGLPMFVLSFSLCIFAAPLSNLILGEQFKESIPVIRILSFLPFIIGMATIYSNFFLLAFGFTRAWSRIIISSSVASLIGALIFVYLLGMGHVGISINILLTEIIVLVSSFVYYRKYAIMPSLKCAIKGSAE